jgi:hypothetical protein
MGPTLLRMQISEDAFVPLCLCGESLFFSVINATDFYGALVYQRSFFMTVGINHDRSDTRGRRGLAPFPYRSDVHPIAAAHPGVPT